MQLLCVTGFESVMGDSRAMQADAPNVAHCRALCKQFEQGWSH